MSEVGDVRIRSTRVDDLDFVLAGEADADASPYIGGWTREQHARAVADPNQEHLLVETELPVGKNALSILRAMAEGVKRER